MKNKLFFGITICIFLLIFALPEKSIGAQTIANPSDVLSRVKVGTLASHTISFRTVNNDRLKAGDSLIVDFDNGFQINPGFALSDISLNDGINRNVVNLNGSCVGQTGENDVAANIDPATSMISFLPCSSFIQSNPNTTITIRIGSNNNLGTNRIQNPQVNGSYLNTLTKNQFTTNFAIEILLEDQMAVNGTVDPMILFSISNNQLSFGQFITTKTRYATTDGQGSEIEPDVNQPVSLYAGSNGQGGVSIYAYDEGDGINSGLWAETINELIPAVPATSVVDNSKTFAVYGKNASGLNLNPIFDNNLSNGEQPITTEPQVIAGTTAPLSGGSFDLVLKASTTSTTRAGHYSDKITVLCTAVY